MAASFDGFFFAVFVVEFLFSLGGYFSSFSTIFVYSFIAFIASIKRINIRTLSLSLAFCVGVFTIGAVWSAVKIDYRNHINQGSGRQVVAVDWADSVNTLYILSKNISGEEFFDGADRLLRRLTYVEIFGATMLYIPEHQAHTHGKLWGSAIVHPFTPRVLFPNKPVIDSSALTNKYSGLIVAGRDSGTQISIGYMGESYIDFGNWGMFFPLFIYGFVLGFVYKRILELKYFSGIISFGMIIPLMMGGSYLNAELIKMIGHFTITSLVMLIVHRYAWRPVISIVFGRQFHSGDASDGARYAAR